MISIFFEFLKVKGVKERVWRERDIFQNNTFSQTDGEVLRKLKW
jgi:hypothetical protein